MVNIIDDLKEQLFNYMRKNHHFLVQNRLGEFYAKFTQDMDAINDDTYLYGQCIRFFSQFFEENGIDQLQYIGDTVPKYLYWDLDKKIRPSITIPDTITTVGYMAFDEYDGELILSDSIKEIDQHAFACCHHIVLQNDTLPRVETIPIGAFSTCDHLKKIIIPDTVKVIEQSAFVRCWELEEVYFEGKVPPKIASLDKYRGIFAYCEHLKDIYVHWPQGSSKRFENWCPKHNIEIHYI